MIETDSPTNERMALAENLRKHPESKEAAHAYTQYINTKVIPQMVAEARPYSFQEYFALALSQASKALEEKNYAVGAVYVYRANGIEVLVGGRNTQMVNKNTHEHAEERAIDKAEALSRGELVDRDSIIAIRKAPHNREEKIVVASLEPCIGCYRRISTHKPNAVWIATPDLNGAMLDGRLEMMPGIWRTRPKRTGMEIITPSDDPQSLSYINPKYRSIAVEMFESTQLYIDEVIKGVHAQPEVFLRKARRSKRRFFR